MSEYTNDQKKYLDGRKRQIEKAIDVDGNYSHNIISSCLLDVAYKIGYEAADDLVDEFFLKDMYGIAKTNRKGCAKNKYC